MCINVACRADVAVPQPLLNLLQAHAIGIEQTGAAIAPSATPSVLSGINRIQRWSQSKPLYLVFLLSSCQYIVFLWKGRGDIRNKHPFGHEAGCSPLPGSVNSGTRK